MYLLLFLIWLIFNSQITLEIVLIGLAVAGAGYALACAVTGWSPKKDLRLARLSGLLLLYVLVLLREVVKSAVTMLSVVLTRSRADLRHSLVTFETDLESDFCRALLANSITLTPGTITVSVDGNCYTVHCLDRSMIAGIRESDFVRLLRKMERIK